jgi:predicted permease
VGGGGHLVRKTLLVGQVALVTALLFAAGLLVRSYGHLEGLDPGFDPEGVLSVQFSLEDARYAGSEDVRRLFRESLGRLRDLPGVASAAVALTLPYERPLNLPFRLSGDDPETSRITNAVYVTPGFFETLRVPLLRGRTFQEGDREGGPVVAVANQAFVDEHLSHGPFLGTPLTMGFGGDRGVEVVGVVGNVQQAAGFGSTSQPVWETPTLYLPTTQATSEFFRLIHVWFSPSWIVRGTGTETGFAARVTRAFQTVDPDLPVARIASLEEVMARAFALQRFEAAFLLLVAGFALLLAGIGLYGIVAHEVVERRSEMGLRMALGASPARAVWIAGAGGVRLTLLGLLVGGGLAVVVGRVLVYLIHGVTPFDPLTLGFLVAVLALFSAVASFAPAARVGRVSPARILQES